MVAGWGEEGGLRGREIYIYIYTHTHTHTYIYIIMTDLS